MTIVQFDSDKYYIQVANLILMQAGLEVSSAALGRGRAVDLLRDIGSQKIKPDVAIVDTLLESNHEEGIKVAEKLRELAPQTKIIAYTTLKDEEVAWADSIAIKGQTDPERTLIEAFKKVGLNLEKGSTLDRS